MANFSFFTIAETIEKLSRKEISPVELIAVHLDRAHRFNPRLTRSSISTASPPSLVHVNSESAILRGEKLASTGGNTADHKIQY